MPPADNFSRRRHRHLLPWERERVAYEAYATAYAARPLCDVQRDWLRVARKKLGEQLKSIDDEPPITLTFDGTLLTIRCAGKVIGAMPARGLQWTQEYSIKARSLREELPKRLMTDTITVSVWKTRLAIGNCTYPLALATDEAGEQK